jgi:hypothetical protein
MATCCLCDTCSQVSQPGRHFLLEPKGANNCSANILGNECAGDMPYRDRQQIPLCLCDLFQPRFDQLCHRLHLHTRVRHGHRHVWILDGAGPRSGLSVSCLEAVGHVSAIVQYKAQMLARESCTTTLPRTDRLSVSCLSARYFVHARTCPATRRRARRVSQPMPQSPASGPGKSRRGQRSRGVSAGTGNTRHSQRAPPHGSTRVPCSDSQAACSHTLVSSPA